MAEGSALAGVGLARLRVVHLGGGWGLWHGLAVWAMPQAALAWMAGVRPVLAAAGPKDPTLPVPPDFLLPRQVAPRWAGPGFAVVMPDRLAKVPLVQRPLWRMQALPR